MMVRKITREEIAEAGLVSAIAFHVRIDDPETRGKRMQEEYIDDNWGAFADNSEIMARVIDSRFTARFDGREILTSGIGAVSTLPEYRNTGAVKAIFAEMLSRERDEGIIVSTLFPFKHSFYNKFGYELAAHQYEYVFKPDSLHAFRHEGWAKLWKNGETAELFTPVYNAFMAKYNFSLVRDDKMMEAFIRGDYRKDGHFCYLLGDNDGACAYVVFDDVKKDGKARLAVDDLAFIGRRGLWALLGFLGRYSADYAEISMPMPPDVDLLKLTEAPYYMDKLVRSGYMARIVNAPKALEVMRKPLSTDFTIEITDEFLPENAGVWRVTNAGVMRSDAAPDIRVSVRALAPMALGFTDLGEALYRNDVAITGDIGRLDGVFVHKPGFITDSF